MPRTRGKQRMQSQLVAVIPSEVQMVRTRQREIEKDIQKVEAHIIRLRESVKKFDVIEEFYHGCEMCGLEWKYKMMLLELDTIKNTLRGAEE